MLKVIVVGSPNSGKTALAKVIHDALYEKGIRTVIKTTDDSIYQSVLAREIVDKKIGDKVLDIEELQVHKSGAFPPE